MLNCIISSIVLYIFTSFGFYMQRNVVAYDEEQPRELEKATVIQDAISDLPAVLLYIYLLFSFFFYVWADSSKVSLS